MSENRAKSVRWSSIEENVKEYTDSEGEEIEWKKAPGQSEVDEEDEPIELRFGAKNQPVKQISDDGNDYQAMWNEAKNEAQSFSDRIEGLCEIIDSSEAEIAELQQKVLDLEEQLSQSQSIPQTGDQDQSNQKIQQLEAKIAALSIKAKNRKTRARKFKAKYKKQREVMKKYRSEARSLRPLAKGGEAEKYKEKKRREKEEKKMEGTAKKNVEPSKVVTPSKPSIPVVNSKVNTSSGSLSNGATTPTASVTSVNNSVPVKTSTPSNPTTQNTSATKTGGSFVSSFNKPSGTAVPIVKAAVKAPTATSTDKLKCALCQHTAAAGKYCKRCGGLMKEI